MICHQITEETKSYGSVKTITTTYKQHHNSYLTKLLSETRKFISYTPFVKNYEVKNLIYVILVLPKLKSLINIT